MIFPPYFLLTIINIAFILHELPFDHSHCYLSAAFYTIPSKSTKKNTAVIRTATNIVLPLLYIYKE